MQKTILLIEDSATNRELMTFLLEEAGYNVLTANDGREGISMARSHCPDLVLCDIHMPIMDGYEVASVFGSDPELRKIPLVALTALAMLGDEEKVLASGFCGYISKPVKPETIAARVGSFLGDAVR